MANTYLRALAGGGAAAAMLLIGCNIFEPFASKRTGDLDYRGLIIRGNDALNEGYKALDDGNAEGAKAHFLASMDFYRRAKEKNRRGSEAYLFHSQAIVAYYGLDFNKLKLEFECKRDTRNAAQCVAANIDTNGIPFIRPTTTAAQINGIYHPVAVAVRDLNYILRDERDSVRLPGGYALPPDTGQASDGVVSPGVARLDLGLLLAINGMLAPLDMDGDLEVNDSCGHAIADAFANRLHCPEGRSSEVRRLDNFKLLTRDVRIDNLDSKDVRARNMSTDPNDINRFIESMQIPVAGSVYNLDSVDRTFQRHAEAQLSKEISGVVANVRDLNNFLNYMRYNDSLDNDFDGQTRSKAASMQWHNFDRDAHSLIKNHGIRFDYNENIDFDEYPTESGDIGHPVHRFLRPALYYTFDSLGKVFPALRADTAADGQPTANSRFGLMRKKCKDILEEAAASPGVAGNRAALDALCNAVAPVLLLSVTPPARSDWVGGPAGVDEEMIDEFDNDYDGIKDEDARNLKGFDDDDDAQLSTALIGQSVQAMQWTDANANRCIDLDSNRPNGNIDPLTNGNTGEARMLDSLLKRQSCMGTLEHRLYLAKAAVADASYRDSLENYYSALGDPGNPADTVKNCMDDYRRKLPAEFKAHLALNDDVANLACRFKHIWIAPRPPRSEWTAGVYGIDEEKFDCVDNDGDGWIDEDVSDRRGGPCWAP